ncbi:hypothetical protein DMENIID0001_073190 [Sergentomyia squamirostris]
MKTAAEPTSSHQLAMPSALFVWDGWTFMTNRHNTLRNMFLIIFFAYRYLPNFLNNSGIYYTTGRHQKNHCYCKREKCKCCKRESETTKSGFVRMNFHDDIPRIEYEKCNSSRNFTCQRQLYEDSQIRRAKSRAAHSLDEKSGTILDSELDIDQLYEICEFREKNSSECMSANNLQRYRKKTRSKIPVGHKCIHKFSVTDHQLKPKPRLSNGQGESVCEICGNISEYLKDHTVSEIIARDPCLGGKDKPIIVLEVMTTSDGQTKK